MRLRAQESGLLMHHSNECSLECLDAIALLEMNVTISGQHCCAGAKLKVDTTIW